MESNIIVVGGGKVGIYLASMLLREGRRVKIIELRPEENATLLRDLPAEAILIGNGADPNMLESAGIRQADVVAAVTGADETNLVVANLAKFEFGIKRVIARVNNPRNAWMYTREMGVDVALNQADLMAHLIVEEMTLGDMTTLLKLRRGEYSLVEEKVVSGSAVIGKPLREVRFPGECVLAAIIRKGELIIPHGDTVLQPDDEVLAVAHSGQVNALEALLGGG